MSRLIFFSVVFSVCALTGSAAGDERPYVRVSPCDHRYFELDNGKPFIPVGLNMVGVVSRKWLKGKSTTLAWCRDIENTWKSELADGAGPRELKDITIDMGKATRLTGATVRIYDPWRDVWTGTLPKGDSNALPPFKRSIVVKITK